MIEGQLYQGSQKKVDADIFSGISLKDYREDSVDFVLLLWMPDYMFLMFLTSMYCYYFPCLNSLCTRAL